MKQETLKTYEKVEGDSIGLDVRDLAARLTKMAKRIGCTVVRAELKLDVGFSMPVIVFTAFKTFKSGQLRAYRHTFPENELENMRKGLSLHMADVFCDAAKRDFEQVGVNSNA